MQPMRISESHQAIALAAGGNGECGAGNSQSARPDFQFLHIAGQKNGQRRKRGCCCRAPAGIRFEATDGIIKLSGSPDRAVFRQIVVPRVIAAAWIQFRSAFLNGCVSLDEFELRSQMKQF